MNVGWLVLAYLSSLVIATQIVPTASDVEWSFEQAQRFYASGAYDQAIDKYAEIIEVKSRILNTGRIQYTVGEITAPVKEVSLYQTGNSYFGMAQEQFRFSRRAQSPSEQQQYRDKANEYLRQAVSFFRETEQQTSVRALKELARNRIIQAWYDAGDYERTIDEAEYLIEKYPDSEYVENARYDIAWSYYEMGQHRESIEAFKLFVDHFPTGYKSDRALFQIGESYYEEEKYQEAIASFQELVTRARIDRLSEQELAQMRREKIAGLIDETILELALKSQIRLGACYAALGDYPKASQAYRSVVGLFTQERGLAEEAYRRLADMYYQAGDFERSVGTYRTAIDEVSDPTFRARMQSLLAELYYNSGRYGEAIREYRIYIKAYDEVAMLAGLGLDEAGYQIGRSFYEMGQQQAGTGQASTATESYQAAIEQYDQVLEEYPDSYLRPACLFNIALCHQMMDTKDARTEAIRGFQALSADSTSGEYVEAALFQIGRIHHAQKEYQEAVGVYQLIINQFPDSPQLGVAYFEKGIAHRDAGQDEQAVSAFLNVASESSLYSSALQEASQCLVRLGAFDRSLEVLGRGIQAAKDDDERARYLYLQGRALVGKESYAEAAARFSEVLDLTDDPEIVESSLYSRGVSFLSLEQYNEAEQDLLQLVQSQDTSIRRSAQRMLGVARIRQNKEEEAIGSYRLLAEEATQVEEKAEYLLLLAELYHGVGKNEETAWAARQILALPLEDLRVEQGAYLVQERAYYLLGDSFVRLKDLASAVQVYREALEAYPDGYYAGDMTFAMGTSYFELGHLENAAETMEAFIQRYPKHPDLSYAYYYAGYSHFNLTQFESAVALFGEVARRFPDVDVASDALFRTGECHFNLGQFGEALAFYREVLEKYPESDQADDALYNMGWTSLELNRGEEAIEYFRSLMLRYPDSEFCPTAQFTIGDYYYNRQEYAEAMRAYTVVSEKYPDSPLAARIPELVEGLRDAMAYRQYEQALTGFREALETEAPEMFQRMVGEFQAIIGDYPGTESEIGALINLGICFESLGRWHEAVSAYDGVAKAYAEGRATREAYVVATAHKDWIIANRL